MSGILFSNFSDKLPSGRYQHRIARDKPDIPFWVLFVDEQLQLVYEILNRPDAFLTTLIKLFTIIEERFSLFVGFTYHVFFKDKRTKIKNVEF